MMLGETKTVRDLERRVKRLEEALATQMLRDHSREFSTWEWVGRRNGMGATTARNFVAKTLAASIKEGTDDQ